MRWLGNGYWCHNKLPLFYFDKARNHENIFALFDRCACLPFCANASYFCCVSVFKRKHRFHSLF